MSLIPTLDPDHPNNIIDSSKLGTFMTCPRKYFYNYILHWSKVEPSIHLEFGTSWHYAKEHILRHGTSPATQAEAMALFTDHFRKSFSEEQDFNLAPKNPAFAKEALTSYCKQFATRNSEMEVLATEIAGKVPISDDFAISFKIDAIIQDKFGIWVMDHKTGSRDSGSTDDAWALSTQMGTYVYAAASYFGPESVNGVYMDLSIFRKSSGPLHKRMPIKKNYSSMEDWLWHAR